MSNEQEPAPVLSMEEARRTYFPSDGPSRNTFYAWAREGRLPTVRIGRRLFVSRKGMEKLLEAGPRVVSDGQAVLAPNVTPIHAQRSEIPE